MIRISLLVVAALLSGCASVIESRAQIDPRLAAQSDTWLLQSSALKINANRLHQPVFDYRIDNARQSWISRGNKRLTQSTTQNVKVKRSFIEWLLSDDIYPLDYSYSLNQKTYEVESKSTFGFVLAQEKAPMQTRCGSFYLEEAQTETVNFSDAKRAHIDNRDGSNHVQDDDYFRVSTFLSCEFTQTGQSVNWSLELPFQQAPVLQAPLLQGPEGKHWKVKILTRFDQILSDGRVISSDQLPPWLDKTAGLEISIGGSPVAAISLVDRNRIWVKRGLPPEQHRQLTAMLVAIFIFNDLDSSWH